MKTAMAEHEDSLRERTRERWTGWWGRSRRFLSEVRNETARVTWPSKKEVYATTLVVILTSVFFGVYLYYFMHDALEDPIPERFEIVINSLFLHHLKTDEIVLFFEKIRLSRAKIIIISDLKRSLTGWLLAHAAGRILSSSPIVHVDGPRSVRAAFSPEEILQIANSSGLANVRVRSIWPLRYLLTAQRS